MNIRRRLTVVAPLALLAAALVAPAPVAAAETTNLAGRPINGYSANNSAAPFQWMCITSGPCTASNEYAYQNGSGTGHGIAYANVDGRLALLYPHHGRAHTSFDGRNVYGPNGAKIGTWAADVCATVNSVFHCLKDYDLAVIWIDAEDRPANLNRVYRGNELFGDNFWTITADPSSSYNCDGMDDGSEWGKNIYQNFQHTSTSEVHYGTYVAQGFLDNNDPSNTCTVKTTTPWHGAGSPSYRDSGTPYIHNSQQSSVWAFGTVRFPNCCGGHNIAVTPLYGGLKVLDTYWEARSRFTGANLCRAADCGGV